MHLRHTTKTSWAIIYKKFWCTTSQLNEFENNIKQNELVYQSKLREQYNPDKLFNNKRIKTEVSTNENLSMIERKNTLCLKILFRFFLLYFVFLIIATLMSEKDMDKEVLRELMGHAEFETTDFYYIHVSEERKKKEFERVNFEQFQWKAKNVESQSTQVKRYFF